MCRSRRQNCKLDIDALSELTLLLYSGSVFRCQHHPEHDSTVWSPSQWSSGQTSATPLWGDRCQECVLNSLLVLAQCRYTKIAQKIFKYSHIQYTSLSLDKELNSLIYRMRFYVNTYGSYKLLKTVWLFWPTLYLWPCQLSTVTDDVPEPSGQCIDTVISIWQVEVFLISCLLTL